VHDIYAEWRHVFNEYDPPRIGFRINTDFMGMVESLPEQEEEDSP